MKPYDSAKDTTATPEKTVYNDRRQTTRAWYSDGRPPHEFYMRGGICWPYSEYAGVRTQLQGYAVLCGQDVNTGTVYVLDHIDFKTIDPMIDQKTQVVIHSGVSEWFNNCWSKWYCRKYYWHDMSTTSRAYRITVSRSKMCEPKPSFPEAKWQDYDSVRALWITMAMTKQFVADAGLIAELKKPESMEAKLHPPTHSIVCALVGLNMHPWTEPKMRRETC